MRHSLLFTVVGGALCACPSPTVTPPAPLPPQVFITVAQTNVIGTQITGTTSVSGCKAVTQVQILTDHDAFLVDANFKGPGSPWELAPATLNRLFAAQGFALTLNLYAKGICDDGRSNTSQPVSVTFFPVESVFSVDGAQALPDAFVAEGGLGGVPTTFIGCVGTGSGVGLARVDQAGTVIQLNQQLPFSCSDFSTISDRSPVRGTRWLLEPGQGAFAFDHDLNITAIVQGKVQMMGVARDGDALLWSNDTLQEQLMRANPLPSSGSPVRWSASLPGIMNSSPVVDLGNGYAWASTWQYDLGSQVGNVAVLKFNYANGMLLNGPGNIVVTQSFAAINTPIVPQGSFNADGSLFYIPLLAAGAGGEISSAVLACATSVGGCEGAGRRWIANGGTFFPGIVSVVLPFGNGGLVAAAGPLQTYFLSAATGAVENRNSEPLRPTGSQIVQAIQPGLSNDFYVLAGPNGGSPYPTEIIASDAPDNGVLWRLDYGGGDSRVGSLYLAVDEGGLVWLRVGPNQVKPLKNSEYRTIYTAP